MNKVLIVGNVGQDVDIRTAGNGKVAALTVATNDGWKDRETGEWRDRIEWHRVVTFQEGLISMLERHGKKGRTVAVTGRMSYREWQKDGETTKRVAPEIVVDMRGEIEFLSPLPAKPSPPVVA